MKRIVVIEDNPDNRLLVEAILEEHYTLVEFDNGPEALAQMRNDPPDLVLLDISLPGMDGTEVLRAMRSDPILGAIPTIALTAHAMAGDRDRFLAAGFDDYVTKPMVDEETLLGAIVNQLDGEHRRSA